MKEPAQLAAFDVDGTLVQGQTQAMLVAHLARQRKLPPRTIASVAAWFAGYRLGLPVDHRAIRLRVLAALAGSTSEEIDHLLDAVVENAVRPRLRPAALQEIAAQRSQGRAIVLVSAAIEPLVLRIARLVGASAAVATRIEIRDGILTGRLCGEIVEGSHKAAALREWANEHLGPWVLASAYGDHYSDLALLELAAEPCAVCPDRRLREAAGIRGWRTADWSRPAEE